MLNFGNSLVSQYTTIKITLDIFMTKKSSRVVVATVGGAHLVHTLSPQLKKSPTINCILHKVYCAFCAQKNWTQLYLTASR